jgi:hypothetical protein
MQCALTWLQAAALCCMLSVACCKQVVLSLVELWDLYCTFDTKLGAAAAAAQTRRAARRVATTSQSSARL